MIPCASNYLWLMDNHSYIIVSIMRGGHLLVNMRMKIKLSIVVYLHLSVVASMASLKFFLLHFRNQELRKKFKL